MNSRQLRTTVIFLDTMLCWFVSVICLFVFPPKITMCLLHSANGNVIFYYFSILLIWNFVSAVKYTANPNSSHPSFHQKKNPFWEIPWRPTSLPPLQYLALNSGRRRGAPPKCTWQNNRNCDYIVSYSLTVIDRPWIKPYFWYEVLLTSSNEFLYFLSLE